MLALVQRQQGAAELFRCLFCHLVPVRMQSVQGPRGSRVKPPPPPTPPPPCSSSDMQPKPKLIHCRKINYNIQSTLVIESMAESDDVGLSQRRWLLGRWFVFNGTARRGAALAQRRLRYVFDTHSLISLSSVAPYRALSATVRPERRPPPLPLPCRCAAGAATRAIAAVMSAS